MLLAISIQTRRKDMYNKFYKVIYILVATTCAEKKTQPMECIHGSLLALRELLTSSGDIFMRSRFNEANEHARKFQSHKEKLVRYVVCWYLY